MAEPMPVIDMFGILKRIRPRRPLWRVLEIMRGEVPSFPGESPWGFPIFRPTTGVSTGPASAGTVPVGSGGGIPGRGVPGGSQRVSRIGRLFGPPTA